jgi:hypothetical protein
MAIPVSDAFKNAMRSPAKTLRAKIVTDEDTPQTFTDKDDLISFTKESVGYYFGTAIRALTFKLIGTDYNLVGRDVSVSFDVQTDYVADTWATLNYGSFRVSEQAADLDKGVTTFKALGFMGIAAKTPYLAGEITFPCTVQSLIEQVAAKLGVAVDTDLTTLPNYDYVITEDLYAKINGITYRDILSEAAGATASLCAIRGGDNGLDFIAPMMSPLETWTYDNLKKIKLKEKYGPINSVVLARTPQEDNIMDSDEDSIIANGLTELKLANNEILDDDRQDLAQPILDAVDGFGFTPFEATTEGHGWHEVGDRIAVTDGTNTWGVIITDIKVELTGGIKETIKGVTPDPTQTDYARAGGIMKTIYNTEIKVDKQNQLIESVVSELQQLDEETQENFTQILQNITNVITSVQNSGGANLIKNSVGYFLGDNGLPLNWDSTVGTSLTIQPSAEAQAHGSLSGNIMTLVGSTVKQRVTVVADSGSADSPRYSFGVRVKKGAVGTGSITITDGVETWPLNFASGDNPYYAEASIKDILPKNNYLDITVVGSSDSDFTVTDMMMAVGEYKSQWTQANGEFANTQVNIDINGVTVASSTVQGARTLQTPFRFGGYQNGNLVYSLDADAVHSKKAVLTDGIDMPPIKIVAMESGWAFVPMEGSN